MLIDRLIERIIELDNPTVVGLDPTYSFLPDFLKQDADKSGKGSTFGSMAYAFFEFNKRVIDAICDIVPAVKPQVAMYEKLGVQGMQCYLDTVRYAKRRGMIVIGDVKRGDIGNTATNYSIAHLAKGDDDGVRYPVFDTDFITINPYMGSDSVEAFVEDCYRNDKGVFVLVKTSNRGGSDFQDLELADGRLLYEAVADKVVTWNNNSGVLGVRGYGRVGAVIGATYAEQLANLRKRMPNVFFLIPGYGAQGGTAADCAKAFVRHEYGYAGGIVNSSRGIINAHNSPSYKALEFCQAVRQSALDMRADLRHHIRLELDIHG